jgi:hypothetical protein
MERSREYKIIRDMMRVFELSGMPAKLAIQTILDILYTETISADEFKRMMGEL